MNVAVFGLGKLGSCLAAWFASAGHMVFGVDPNRDATNLLNAGRAPVEEPGLQELLDLHHSRVACTDDAVHAASKCEFLFLIVPTPSQADGTFSSWILEETLVPIAEAIRRGAHPVVVVVSTTSPGTMEGVVIPRLQELSGCCCGLDFDVCFNPEFIALGSVLADMASPSFILIGESTKKAGDALEQFYRDLHTTLGNEVPPFARMNLVNAEITKLGLNCAVTTKISYANSLAALCENVPGADARVVCSAVGLDRRIGRAYLQPATAFGGPCFGRDNRAMIATGNAVGVEMPLSQATDEVNRAVTERLLGLLLERNPRTVAVLGLTYKTATPVVEESQGVKLLDAMTALAEQGSITITTHDPQGRYDLSGVCRCQTARDAVAGAEAVVIATPWGEYCDLAPRDFHRSARIVDCWSVLNPQEFQGWDVVIPGRYFSSVK